MLGLRQLTVVGLLALAAPAASAAAEPQWGATARRSPAYDEGFSRGRRAGVEDSRRGDRFAFADESEYRKADSGYRSDYGVRGRYQDEFRRGFEAGYRDGYRRDTGYDNGRYDDRNGPGFDARGGFAAGRSNPAFQQGQQDGYEAGVNDARARRRYDPIAESRYRSGDRGYERRFGSKDAYRDAYREAFKQGYSRGFDEGRRYGQRPSWWPF
jgi:hypothetical protein